MPRTARASVADVCYHVLSRGNARQTILHDEQDFEAFVRLLARAGDDHPMRLLAWCLMSNHVHFVVRPLGDGDLGSWMQWLLTCHVRYHQRRYATIGRIWQGRFKAFPIQQDGHLLTVMRYVERGGAWRHPPVRSASAALRRPRLGRRSRRSMGLRSSLHPRGRPTLGV